MSIDNEEFRKKLFQWAISGNYDCAAFRQLIATIDSQMERDRKDAERYRWLREVGSDKGAIEWSVLGVISQDLGGLDAAIDAELAKNKKEIDAG